MRWTVPPEPDVVGYYVYAGPASGSYVERTSTGRLDYATASGVVYYLHAHLQAGVHYYFAVTAINSAGQESAFSNEKHVVFSGGTGPAVDAGPDQVGSAGDVLTLGSASATGVSYFWEETSGTPATLSNRFASLTQFQSFSGGSFDLALIAYDAQGIASQDGVSVLLAGPSPLPTSPPRSPTNTGPPTATRTPSRTQTATPTGPTATPTATRTPAAHQTRLYLTSLPPSYAPAQTQGQWYIAPGAQVLLSPLPGGLFANALRQESQLSTVDIGLLWGISEPLTAVQFDAGSALDWAIEAAAQSDDAEFYWHVHLTILVGDSDNVRCTLLDDYREDVTNGTPWLDISVGQAPRFPVPLHDCTATPPQPGDRLAIELGFVARNTFNTARYGLVNYGTGLADVVSGQSGGAPWIDLLGVTASFAGQSLPTSTPIGPSTATPNAPATSTASPTQTSTRSPTPTTAVAPVGTATRTPTRTPTWTPTRTFTPPSAQTATRSNTPTATATRTGTGTPTQTAVPPTPLPGGALRLYLTSLPPSYAPTQARGAWYLPPAQKVLLSRTKGGSLSNSLKQEAVSKACSVGLLMAISDPFAAASFPAGSRLSWGIEVAEQSADADMFWHVHAYVLAGSTTTVRCTLLNNYQESATSLNEWPTTASARSPQPAAPALTGCAPRAGDRLVIEIGYIARNGISSSRYGFLNDGSTAADTVPGVTGGAAWVELSGGATLSF